jgi:hypothetical protein
VIARAAIGLMAVVLAACQIVQVETPDPAAVPSGSLVARGAEATGPIVEVGSGQASGIGWRYVVYPSADGLCVQLETSQPASASCGVQLPAEGSAFGSVGAGDAGTLQAVDGLVAEDIATVWVIEADSGRRFPAILMPLDDAELEGQAFVGFVPEDMEATHLQALRLSGEIVETYELP